VFDDSVDMSSRPRFAMEFCAIESCGKCHALMTGSVEPSAREELIDRVVPAPRCRASPVPDLTTLSIVSRGGSNRIRHGDWHLPQDSMAQNSIAKRACFDMSTLSSNTTMPPWPIRPSRAAKDS